MGYLFWGQRFSRGNLGHKHRLPSPLPTHPSVHTLHIHTHPSPIIPSPIPKTIAYDSLLRLVFSQTVCLCFVFQGLGDPPSDVSSARVRKAPVTSGVGSRSSSILSTDGAGTSSAVSNVASPVSSTSRLVCHLQGRINFQNNKLNYHNLNPNPKCFS